MTRRLPTSRAVALIVVIMLSAATAQAFGRFTYAVVLPAVQRDLSISYTLAGSLGTSNLVAYLVGTATASVAATRWSVVRMVQVSLLLSTAGLAALAFGTGLEWMWFGMVATGLAGAGIWVPSPGLAAAAAPPRWRGLAIGFVGTGIGLGLVFASFFAAGLTDAEWRLVYRVETVIAVAATVSAFAWLGQVGEVATARPRLSVIRTIPGWHGILAIYTVYGLSMSFFVNFLTALLRDDAGWSPAAAAATFSIFGIASVGGGPIFGQLADRMGRLQAMMIGLSGMAAAAIVVLAGAQPWVTLGAGLFGIAFAGVPTSIAALISDHVDAQSFGAAFGVATLAFGIAQIFGPQAGGMVGDTAGSFRPVFVASAVLALLGVTLALRMVRRPPGV